MSDVLHDDVLLGALSGIHRVDWEAYPRWEALIRQAREATLLGTLAHRLHESGHFDAIPEAPRAHLAAARIMSAAQHVAVKREIAELHRALHGIGVTVILLKGAAYVVADSPAAPGRLFTDVDILVPKSALPEVESALMLAGFATTHPHPYDQRYYRRMHELPPMQHVRRSTVLDVHHTIVPNTTRIRLDAGALFLAALPLSEPEGFSVLAPADMVLHSAVHLFENEDLTHGLRDLVDIDVLLGQFGRDEDFWQALVARAGELDLWRSLHYALRWTARALGTRIPDDIMATSAAHAPGAFTSHLMDELFGHALRPTAAQASTRWSRRALYVRGHWLKMPVALLAWHLTVKALRREQQPA